MNGSPQQYFLNEAGAWLDLYGSFSCESNLHSIDFKIKHLARDPSSLVDSLDLLKHLALYTGGLWRDSPTVFTGRVPDLIAPLDNISGLEGVEYDKRVLETVINRCARLPRQENADLAVYGLPGWDYDPLDYYYVPANTNENLIEAVNVYYWALAYENDPALLNILLGDAWELYLRAWERVNA